MAPLTSLILATLAYSDIFNFPLTIQEVGRWLVGNSNWETDISHCATNNQYTDTDICRELKNLVGKKRVGCVNGYYFLFGRRDIINARLTNNSVSINKMAIANKTVKVLRTISWINLIAITGSLAMNNCHKNDDIDLLIITKTNSLWLTRLLVVILLRLSRLRVRRYGALEANDQLCLNVFMDENDLLIKERNMFTAHEVAQIKPILNRGQTYERLLSVNQWINYYLPNLTINKVTMKSNVNLASQLFACIIAPINILSYRFQYHYMKLKRTNETINYHQAFFHPDRLSRKIKKSFLTRMADITKIAVGMVK